MFAAGMETVVYNVENYTGAASLYDGGTGAFYRVFDISYTGVAEGINLHIDMFSLEDEEAGEIVRGIFAPFSHDAEIVNSCASSRTAAVVAELGSLRYSRSARLRSCCPGISRQPISAPERAVRHSENR